MVVVIENPRTREDRQCHEHHDFQCERDPEPAVHFAVKVPAWSSSDKVLRLKGRGLPEKAGGHGDLYAHVRVMLPEGGDPELERLAKKWAG